LTFTADYYIASLRLLRDCLCSKAQAACESDLIKPIEKLIDCLKPGDSVITFNWDTLIETLLHERGLEFNLTGGNEKSINILKLHGSLSWIKYKSNEELIHRLEEEYRPLNENNGVYCTIDHSMVDTFEPWGIPPFIVPPTSNKTPLNTDFLRDLWVEAYKSLRDANKIVAIGYSLPKDDLHARALMVTGCKGREITIIDPNPSVAERYFSSVTPKLNYLQRRYDGSELIDCLKPGDSVITFNWDTLIETLLR
jgi:hypothetical protein